MSRINTNVSSLTAQSRLNRTNMDLQTSLTRLSTGLRINTGKDDPAGLIASEALRSDITSINKALSNTQRANQIIATADSALGQVSSLLNDIRGLVTEAANNGALSDSEIAANQLQVDSSLEAINRISQTTTFQGRRLLDGSLDFLTTQGSNFSKLSDLQINQANLGTTGSVAVNVNVTSAATKATMTLDIPTKVESANASADLAFSNTAAQATGTINFGASSLTISADSGGLADGAEGNAFNAITITYGAASAGAVYDADTNTLAISVTQASGVATTTNIQAAINGGSDFTASGGGATTVTATTGTATMAGGRDAGSSTLQVSADEAGTTANGVTVTLTEDNSITNNSVSASIVGGNIDVRVRGTVTRAAIASAINDLEGYSASITASSGDQDYIQSLDTPPSVGTLGGGQAASGGLTQDVVMQLSGASGAEVVSLKAGASVANLAAAINLVKDSTGVEATVDGNTLELTSQLYGSSAFVNLQVINEGVGGTITAELGGASKDRVVGTDIVATINGVAAKANGNVLSMTSSTLSFSASMEAGFTGTSTFNITGGGTQFQLGPTINGSQQARLGISSVSTSALGGTAGKLYQLGTGESFSLKTDAAGAAKVVNQVIDKVASLRGRLGAFQRTTLDSNSVSLNDTLSNLNEAQSSIRDADFAKESANLTRAQILVQSGTSVLGIANQSAQSVLALLR